MLLLNSYQTPVKATLKFLTLLKVKVNAGTINETLQNHPDWPSLLCISDALNGWNVSNAAGKIAWTDIDQLPVPFMAYMYNPEHPIAVVTKVNEHTVEAYQNTFSKSTVFTREAFFEQWKGIYLIAEPDSGSGEANYRQQKRKQLLTGLLPAGFIALCLYIAIERLQLNTITSTIGLSKWAIWVQFFILLAGVGISAMLLWYELDKNNPLLKQVCTGIAKGNCSAILTGAQSKVFSWLSWSEVGFLYFAGGLLTLIFSPSLFSAINLLGWLHFMALPYTVFSIYYQWRVAKQWCVLCLGVQVLLVAGAINYVAGNFQSNFTFIDEVNILNVLFCYAGPALLWYSIKPYLLQLQQAKTTKRQYLRLKFNTEIFETLLKKQKAVKLPTEEIGIKLGLHNAQHTLVKVCNPYCGPCSKAHPKIEELLHALPNLKANIIFTTPYNPALDAYHPVNHLLAIQETAEDELVIKRALDEWYLPEKKDYELFKAKYPLNGELSQQGGKIERMDKWCTEADIRATPTIFITAPSESAEGERTLYQIPDAYSVEDLKYFLQE